MKVLCVIKRIFVFYFILILCFGIFKYVDLSSFAYSKNTQKKEVDFQKYTGDYSRFNESFVSDIESMKNAILEIKVLNLYKPNTKYLFEYIYEPIMSDFKTRKLHENLDSYYNFARLINNFYYDLIIINEDGVLTEDEKKYLNLIDNFLTESINKNKEIYNINNDMYINNLDKKNKYNKDAYKKRDITVYDEFESFISKYMKKDKNKDLLNIYNTYEEIRVKNIEYKKYIKKWDECYFKLKGMDIKPKCDFCINKVKRVLDILQLDIKIEGLNKEFLDEQCVYENDDQSIKLNYDYLTDELHIDLKNKDLKKIINIFFKLDYDMFVVENNNWDIKLGENINDILKKEIASIEFLRDKKSYYDKNDRIYINFINSTKDSKIKVNIKNLKLFLENKDLENEDYKYVQKNKEYIKRISKGEYLQNIVVFKEKEHFEYRALFKLEDSQFGIEFLFEKDEFKRKYLENYIEFKDLN